jgi:cytoskeletal protein RodZ
MHLNNTHKARTVVIIVVTVLFILGGGGLFYWLSLTKTLPTNPTDNTATEAFDNTPTINPSYSSNTDNPNSDTRDPEKSPEQYDGQNAAGDTSNANCPDGDCSNFNIPKEETQ